MESFWGEWIILLLNAIIIAVILTSPILFGVLILWSSRKELSKDRLVFDDEIKAKLEEIIRNHLEIKNQLDDVLR